MKHERPTHVDLFSGIGGFALAAQWAGFETIAFCEIDRYCRKVLAKNFGAGISSNIFDFDGTKYRGCDLITGGFPCQPFSVAGKRRGAADDRALWPEMFRVINEARPAWVLGENVPGIIPMELDNVLSQLEGIGYACRPFVIPACAVDARHRRDRLWIVGYAAGAGREGLRSEYRLRKGGRKMQIVGTGSNGGTGVFWLPEPDVGRVAHGIPSRVDRLKGLGNAIVPQVACEILKEIRNQHEHILRSLH